MAKTVGLGLRINIQTGDMIVREETGLVIDPDTDTLIPGVTRKYATYVEGLDEVKQALHVRLLTKLGEDVLNGTIGLPVKAIFAVNRDDYTATVVKACIEGDPRVESVTSIKVERTPATREVLVSYNARLRDSTNLTVNEVFLL